MDEEYDYTYTVEFIVCFQDHTWEVSPPMPISWQLYQDGREEIIFEGMNRVLRPYSEDMERPVVHYGIYAYTVIEKDEVVEVV